MSFSNDLQVFNKRTLKKAELVKRKSALDLFSAIVLETPVDKGVLRNNWFAAIGSPSAETTRHAAPSGNATVGRIKSAIANADLEQDILLTNNLPYAVPIEFDGHSQKARQGMVRVNTLRWDDIVAVNIRKAQNVR